MTTAAASAPSNSLTGTTAQTPIHATRSPPRFEETRASAASRTTRANCSRSARLVHERRRQRHLRRDLRCLLRVAVGIHHIAIEQIAISLGDSQRRSRVHSELGHHLGGRTFDRAAANDRRNRDDRLRAEPREPDACPATARIGLTLMKGLEGQMITARSRWSPKAARRSG